MDAYIPKERDELETRYRRLREASELALIRYTEAVDRYCGAVEVLAHMPYGDRPAAASAVYRKMGRRCDRRSAAYRRIREARTAARQALKEADAAAFAAAGAA